MAKKLLYNRVKASMYPVYEDISDDEFDPTDIQIVEKPFNYLDRVFNVYRLTANEKSKSESVGLSSAEEIKSEVISNDRDELIEHKDDHVKDPDHKLNISPEDETNQKELSHEREHIIALDGKETEEPGDANDIIKQHHFFVKVRDEFKIKPSEETLLMEWGDFSENQAKEVDSSFYNESSTRIKPIQIDLTTEDLPPPPSIIPYFFVEQKELLSRPWKIQTTPLNRKTKASDILDHFDCPHCTRKYWKQSKLREHMKVNHFDKMNKVGISDAVIKKLHISKCPECKKLLKTKTDMYVHRLTHFVPGFTTMSCCLCGESQYTYNSLKHHFRNKHSLHEKWVCPVCPDARTFTQNHSLLIHISNFHFDSTKALPLQYPCSRCDKQFSNKALLGRHITNVHKKKACYSMFKCDSCEKDYETFQQLKKHFKKRHAISPSLPLDVNSDTLDFTTRIKLLKKSLLNNS